MNIQRDVSLEELNTFGIKVNARYFAEISSVEDLQALIQETLFKENKVLLLGGGSNILFTNDFDGLVLKVTIGGIHVVKESEHFFWVKAVR